MSVALVLALVGIALAQVPSDGVGMLIGGFQGGISIEVITGDAFCNAIDAVPQLPNAPSGQLEGWSAEWVDGQTWLCGGSNVNTYSDCYYLKVGDSYWTYGGETNVAREYGTSFVFNGEMIIMGGYNDRNGWLDFVEKRRTGSTTWDLMSEWTLPRKMFDLCADQMDETHIIIAGGNEVGNIYSPYVTVLDTTTGVWTEVEQLPVGVAEHDCLTTEIDGERGLLLTGGCTEKCQNHLNDARFFSYSTMSWTQLSPMAGLRDRHKMTHLDGLPAVVGGAVPTGPVSTVEVFDGSQWSTRPERLEFPRSSFGMPKHIPRSEVQCP